MVGSAVKPSSDHRTDVRAYPGAERVNGYLAEQLAQYWLALDQKPPEETVAG